MARAAEAGKGRVEELAKSNCISILHPRTGIRRAGLRAMENDSRSRALARSMLKKAMERGMVLPPHRQHPDAENQGVDPASRKHDLQPSLSRVQRPFLVEYEQEREQ